MRNQDPPTFTLRSISNSGWLILTVMSLAGVILRDVSTGAGVAIAVYAVALLMASKAVQ